MKRRLTWAAEHWYFLILLAILAAVILSVAGIKPAPDASRFLEEPPYTGKDIVWKETPNSTCFSYVGYDNGHEKLALIFRSNETRTYVYSEFLSRDYQDFMAAESLGSYYNANIKGLYPSERIDDTKGTYFAP